MGYILDSMVYDAVDAAVMLSERIVVVASLVVYGRCVVGAEGLSLLELSGHQACLIRLNMKCMSASVAQIALSKVHRSKGQQVVQP